MFSGSSGTSLAIASLCRTARSMPSREKSPVVTSTPRSHQRSRSGAGGCGVGRPPPHRPAASRGSVQRVGVHRDETGDYRVAGGSRSPCDRCRGGGLRPVSALSDGIICAARQGERGRAADRRHPPSPGVGGAVGTSLVSLSCRTNSTVDRLGILHNAGGRALPVTNYRAIFLQSGATPA